MTNAHWLEPCIMCPTRMAIPGSPICTMCAADLIDAAAE